MKVIDNFLPENIFRDIQKTFISDLCPFYFNMKVSSKKEKTNHFYFTHCLYDENEVTSKLFYKVKPILEKLDIHYLRRIKINLYTRDKELIKHEAHKDYPSSHNGAIYSLNTCNGGTYVGKKFVKSVENRILLFDPSVSHLSTNCTDEQARFNINFNWKQ